MNINLKEKASNLWFDIVNSKIGGWLSDYLCIFLGVLAVMGIFVLTGGSLVLTIYFMCNGKILISILTAILFIAMVSLIIKLVEDR